MGHGSCGEANVDKVEKKYTEIYNIEHWKMNFEADRSHKLCNMVTWSNIFNLPLCGVL